MQTGLEEEKIFYLSGALYAWLRADLRTYFYENGTVKTVEPYQEGLLHGEVVLYWPNGQMKRRVHFVLGVRHGLDQIWDETGLLVDEDHYG
jgi:antitoxin component YwqK of YwqJK toxin-antitoxin module